MEDSLEQRQVCKTTSMTLRDNLFESELDYKKKESIKARDEVKEVKRAAQEATPTNEYVKLVQDLYVENAKLNEGQPKATEYKKYMQEFATPKATLTKDLDSKL